MPCASRLSPGSTCPHGRTQKPRKNRKPAMYYCRYPLCGRRYVYWVAYKRHLSKAHDTEIRKKGCKGHHGEPNRNMDWESSGAHEAMQDLEALPQMQNLQIQTISVPLPSDITQGWSVFDDLPPSSTL